MIKQYKKISQVFQVIPSDKHEELVRDYIQLGTLQAVGSKWGVSRERIRQIITGFSGYQEYKQYKHDNNRKILKCLNCGTEKKVFFSSKEKFCSRDCRKKYYAKSLAEFWAEIKTMLCYKCGLEKPIEDFSIGKVRMRFKPNVLKCKKCAALNTRKYYQNHKPEIQAYVEANIEHIRAYNKEWQRRKFLKNPELIREKRRAYCLKNKEVINEKARIRYHARKNSA